MNNLKAARKAAGLRQIDVARAVGIGQSGYSDWERGRNRIDDASLKKLAQLLNVTTDYLLGHNEPESGTVIWEGKEYRTVGRWIPVLGSVPAGMPIEAVEDITDYEEISPELAAKGEYVGLRIRGDSMEPRMKEGDVVIVRLQETVDNGDTAVVLVNGDEATCKRIKQTPEGVMLIPTNPAYEPWFYSNEEMISKPVRILGKVVELRAKF